MKYLKLFNNNSEYNSSELVLPNVSYVKEEDLVYYNPYQEPARMINVYFYDDGKNYGASYNENALGKQNVPYWYSGTMQSDFSMYTVPYGTTYEELFDIIGWKDSENGPLGPLGKGMFIYFGDFRTSNGEMEQYYEFDGNYYCMMGREISSSDDFSSIVLENDCVITRVMS